MATSELESSAVYRIYLQVNGAVSCLTMEAFPATGKPPAIITRPDDQDPYVNSFQQWRFTKFEGDTGLLVNIGSGLFLQPDYALEPNMGLKGGTHPYPWSIMKEGDGFGIGIMPSSLTIGIEGAKKDPGTKAALIPFAKSNGTQRTWLLKKARRPGSQRALQPHVSAPTLKSGSYRLRSAIIHTYLTDPATDANGAAAQRPNIVVTPFETGNASQEWIVDLDERSSFYTIKNKKSGAYIQGDSSRAGFNADISSASSEKPITSTTPVFWDIREGEFEGQYAIHVPGLSTALELTANRDRMQTEENKKEVNVSINPRYNYYNINQSIAWYHMWWFEPVSDVRKFNALSPTPYQAPLKTGTYYIKNTASGSMLTQRQALPAQNLQHIRDPFVVGLPYESDNAFQEWTVRYLKDIGMYVVKNGGSGRYLSSVLTTGDESYALASSEKTPWMIRQSESLEEFMIQLPRSQQTLVFGDAPSGDEYKTYIQQREGRPNNLQQRWIFVPVEQDTELGDPEK